MGLRQSRSASPNSVTPERTIDEIRQFAGKSGEDSLPEREACCGYAVAGGIAPTTVSALSFFRRERVGLGYMIEWR